MEIFEEESGIKGPPKATLVRRAKSYSDFYEAAIGYFGKKAGKEKPKDALEVFENGKSEISLEGRYEEYENDLLDASHEEYQ
jgi:conserved oligomeric Golgi complex subunit 3